MSNWTLTWCAPNSDPIGNIEATDIKLNTVLNGPSTIEFTTPIETVLGPEIAFPTYGVGVVKLYQDGVIRGVFETNSIQLKGTTGGDTVGVVGTDLFHTMTSAYVLYGPSAAGGAYTVNYHASTCATMAQAAATVLSDMYGLFAYWGFTGPHLTSPSTVSGSGGFATTSFDPASTVLSMIHDLAFRASGFDFWVPPVEPNLMYGNTWSYGTFNAASKRGTTKPDIVFEYRTGRNNVEEHTHTYTAGDHLCNIAASRNLNTGSAGFDYSPASVAVIGPRLRVIDAEFSDVDLLNNIAEEHVNRRRWAREVFTFQPSADDGTGRVPVPFEDYDLGDIITARAAVPSGDVVVDGGVRVYGIEVSVDANGKETVNLQLTQDTA